MQKVIIIGAGPAGLTAANELLKLKKYEVIVLEESNSIGGISKTVNYKGNRMDIGGHRFFSKDERIAKYWEEILPMQETRRVSRILYSRKFFNYPITLNKETLKNMGILTTIKVGISYIKTIFLKRKENNLEDFYINRFGKTLYEMFFKDYTQKLWGKEPKEISPEFGMQRVKGLSIIEIIKDIFNKKNKRGNKKVQTSLIEKFLYPKYGPGQLWEALAEKIEAQGGRILKKHKVEKINIERNTIKSVICNVEGQEKKKEIKGDIFISSMPLKDLVKGINGEAVPKNIKEIAEGLLYRDFITVGVLAKKLKLKNNTKLKTIGNIVPDCWIYIQEPDVKLGRLQIFNNWSLHMVKDAEKTVWIGLEYFVQENDEYWNMSEKEFINFAISELEKIGVIDKPDVIDAHQEKMKKAYPAYFGTYSKIDQLRDYLNQFENLYCIGRNGQHRYNNMDHSMLTAIEAVENINKGIKDKSNIWNVNTEKEYHEMKNKRNINEKI